jgi:transcriptional regulator with XRE-family HTH domain
VRQKYSKRNIFVEDASNFAVPVTNENPMLISLSAEEYRAARQRIGRQELVAELLGVGQPLISKRERGLAPIGAEASLALLLLLDASIAEDGQFSAALRRVKKSVSRQRDAALSRAGAGNSQQLQAVNSHRLPVSKERKILNLWEAVGS